MALSIKSHNLGEVKKMILKNLKSKRAPGIDLISGKILNVLSHKGFLRITYIFNAILVPEYFPFRWE